MQYTSAIDTIQSHLDKIANKTKTTKRKLHNQQAADEEDNKEAKDEEADNEGGDGPKRRRKLSRR